MTLRRQHWVALAVITVTMAASLIALGRNLICQCGYVKLWHGEVISSENSQHILDWYSPSHVLHGLVFYMALHFLLPRLNIGGRLVVAAAIEAAWEIIENTSWIIDKYREDTIALDYYGDSVLNSGSDMAMMIVGFVIAARAPVWLSVCLFIAAELVVGFIIRDGLLLNIIMLLYPLEWIRQWQAG
ncbi:DUF2585 family protein [Anderseniella sp. Alg231-50]|uniref:DUF2585 family protein n=1 Tax=Anderseniella sp. Alg231-50 TaxID=1922226 RepID=UPI00307C49F3